MTFSRLAFLISAATITPSFAQEARFEQLPEVVVTAEKRESTVQNTPISLAAVSGQEIEDRGISNVFELTESIPGVSMRTSGPGQTEFEMRGMASTGGNSSTVGFYLDDAPLNAAAQTTNGKVVIDPNLYDVNRIEVLRGPQGTLYGSGSMGGTIKVVTNAPSAAAFDASAQAILSDTPDGGFNEGVNAMVNVPLGSTLALRIVGSESHTSGWIDRIVTADESFPLPINNNKSRGNVLAAPVAKIYKDVNSTDLDGSRASLLWTPTDRLGIQASYLFQRISQDGPSEIDSNPGTDAHYQPFDAAEPFSDHFNLGTLNVRYHFDGFDFTSETAHWTRDETYHQDGAEQWQWVLGLPSYYTSQGGIGAFTPTPYEQDLSRQTSEEARLTSSGSGKFQWLLGYFYDDFVSYLNANLFAPGAVPLVGTSNVFYAQLPTKIIQQSVFGEVSYQLTSSLKAIAGLRRYSYDNEVQITESGPFSPSGSTASFLFHSVESNQGLNPKVSLSYEPMDTLLAYATASKGFRPGGGNGPVPTSGNSLGDLCEANLQSVYHTSQLVPSPNTFDPDSVWNYEIGEKWRTAGNRIVLNSSIYFEDWKGVQQNIPLACGYFFTGNAGDAHVYGSEVEMQALLGSGFSMALNVGYTHAALVSSHVFGVGIDAGTPIQQVPEWTTSQWLAYRHHLSGRLAFTARLENSYTGTRTDATYQVNKLPSYDLTSIRGGVESDNWSATLFVTNLFGDRAQFNNVNQLSANLPTYNRIVVAQPATIGLDVTYRFGK